MRALSHPLGYNGAMSTGTTLEPTGAVPAGTAPDADEPEGRAAGPRSVPVHLSPSSSAMFAQCPRRWQLRYVERLPDPPGAAALVGTLVHRVLERLLGDPPEGRTVERARALAAEEWPLHHALPDVAALGLDADGVKRYKWQVWEAVAGLWKLEDPAAVDVLATECRLDVQLGSVPFLGVLDRVDATADGVVVTDYKSGRPPSATYAGDKLDQVLLYAAAWRETSGEPTRRARLHYLGARSIEVDTTDEAIDGAVGRLHERWDTLHRCLDTDTFAARTGPLCAWCPYTAHCPEGSGEVRRRVEAGLVPLDAPAVRSVV